MSGRAVIVLSSSAFSVDGKFKKIKNQHQQLTNINAGYLASKKL